MYRLGIVGVAVMVAAGSAACTESSPPSGSDSGPGPDASGPDAGNDDGGGGTAGLGVSFFADPRLPGDVGGDFAPAILQEATLELEDLRAVGDSATGEGTTEPSLVLHWGGEDGGEEEEEGEEEEHEGEDEDGGDDGSDDDDIGVFFDAAPPGIYSHVLTDIISYHMRGTMVVDGNPVSFEISDTPPTAISISINLGQIRLESGESETLRIRARLRDAVREPRWDEIAPTGGVLVIDGGSSQIGTVREKLADGFGSQDDD